MGISIEQGQGLPLMTISRMLMMFHLNVFYLPVLEQVVGQYKMWNEVMFWFSQIIIYNQQKQ